MADSLDVLVADLVALGRSVPVAAPDDRLAVAVVARVATAPRARSRRRPVAVVVSVVLAALLGSLAAPPVRAAVADWFGFAAVLVHLDDDSADGTGTAGPPRAGGDLPLRVAASRVDFVPVVPRALGRPDGVELSTDRRVLSLTWDRPQGVVRLDQLAGTLDYVMAKTARDVRFTTVGDAFALWFDRPHEVVALDADGTERRESARLAGRTLIWEGSDATLRLEGDLTLGRARAIAASARPVGGG